MNPTTSKTNNPKQTAQKTTKPPKITSKPDLLWKDLFTEFHSEAILFFLGKKAHNAIDFSYPPEFLEQELNETFLGNEPNKKITDKIIRYKLKNGKFRYLILHVEFQGKAERNFAERMYRYFVYIYLKYQSKDVTALAIYTGAARPKIFNTFTISCYGTKLIYKFNTYTIRDQSEAKLLQSDNPIAIAVLASLYLIKAGIDPNQRLAYKKNLIEIAREKNFDRTKLLRLFNFVKYLIKIPPKFELEFKEYIDQSKNQEKMEYSIDFLETFASREVKAIRKEEREKGREEEREKAREEREKAIMNIRKQLGFNAKQIATLLPFPIKYIQSVIEKYEKKEKDESK